MLPLVVSVIDGRRHQNVFRTSVTHSPNSSWATFCSYMECICYTDIRVTCSSYLTNSLLFNRILSKAQQLESQVRNRQIEKEYICKVQGEFPR